MKSTTRRHVNVLAGVFCAGLSALGSSARAFDLSLPAGARATVTSTTPNDQYALPLGGWNKTTNVPFALLEGEVRRKAWRIPSTGITTGQVIGPLRDQLLAAQYDVLFECTAASCGGFDFRFGTEVLPAPDMYVDLTDFRFLSAKANDATQALSVLVSRDGDDIFVQFIEVGPPRGENVSVTTSAVPATPEPRGDLISQLETFGHVVLSDLEFASGSSSLGAGAPASLEAIARYLLANPSREITFVGHTDATGSLAANITVSQRRAEAARSYVVQKGVPSGQVAAEGVGFLSPRASNLTVEGREANRRVEAVLISVK